MRRLPTVFVAASIALTLVAAAPARGPAPRAKGHAPVAGLSDSAIGLSRTSVFSVPAPRAAARPAGIPGERPRYPRAYPDAPPRIPHAIEDFLPITRDHHACLECHDRATAKETGAVELPASHYRDLRRAPRVERETIAGARYVCTSCHVPQTDAPPLVGNSFRSR